MLPYFFLFWSHSILRKVLIRWRKGAFVDVCKASITRVSCIQFKIFFYNMFIRNTCICHCFMNASLEGVHIMCSIFRKNRHFTLLTLEDI